MADEPVSGAEVEAGLGRGGALEARLRNRQLGGHKFVRQMPIGPYFADFVCREHKVVVEVDGATHSTAEEIARDAKRTAELEGMGYRIFRVGNDDVYHNVDCVLDALLAFVEGEAHGETRAAAPHPGPLPASGEREAVR